MRYRKVLEIGDMVAYHPRFLPKMQIGQWVTVYGGRPGRWVGVGRSGVVYIVWLRKAQRAADGIRKYRKCLEMYDVRHTAQQ